MIPYKARIVYAGVDGTGETNDASYARTFENSFVNQYYKNWEPGLRFYHRGPTLLGTQTANYAREAYHFIKRTYKLRGAQAVFLAGYSRGGAAVIEVASWLQEDDIEVECLILFDAVDRSSLGGVGGTFNNTPIPANVKHLIHAKRMARTQSRESFGNCGTTYERFDQKRYAVKEFFATHGGLGGTPWNTPRPSRENNFTSQENAFIYETGELRTTKVTYKQDKIGSTQVWNWVNPKVFDILSDCKDRLVVSGQPGPQGTRYSFPQVR